MYTLKGTHEHYTRTHRHWCPRSEAYTGADSLLSAQRQGWRLLGLAYQEKVMLGAGRYTNLYHFKLAREGEVVLMPVINNPFVQRLLKTHNIAIVPIIEAEFDEATTEIVTSLLA